MLSTDHMACVNRVHETSNLSWNDREWLNTYHAPKLRVEIYASFGIDIQEYSAANTPSLKRQLMCAQLKLQSVFNTAWETWKTCSIFNVPFVERGCLWVFAVNKLNQIQVNYYLTRCEKGNIFSKNTFEMEFLYMWYIKCLPHFSSRGWKKSINIFTNCTQWMNVCVYIRTGCNNEV